MPAIRLATLLMACSLVSASASAVVIDPFEMRGLRLLGGITPLVLDFSAVKSGTEDRTVIHFDISTFSGSTAGATLNLGINNFDPGAPAGSIDVYAFAGDGAVSPDEWASGSFFHTFVGIAGGFSSLTVDVSALLTAAVSSGDDYLSFNLRTFDSDRYLLNSTIGGVTSSVSGEGPTFIDVPATGVPEPYTLALLCAGLSGLGLIRRRRAA